MHRCSGGTAAVLCLAKEFEIESGLLRGFPENFFCDVSDRILLDCTSSTWIVLAVEENPIRNVAENLIPNTVQREQLVLAIPRATSVVC